MSLFDKLMRLIGFEEEVVEEEVALEPEPAPEVKAVERSRKGKVISLPNQERLRVVVVEPVTFEESKRIVDHLKERQPVVVNLEETEEELAQRIIDFVSGATFATDGRVQKVGQGIFLFTPPNVDITAEVKEMEGEGSYFPWVR